MKKKTNYFSHDSNSRNDSKILAIRIKYGVEGYGIFFMILERLREESDYMCIKDYNSIAFDLRVESSKVKSVVEDFGLFIFTDDSKYFYSESFMKRMEFKDEKSKKASESANKRWEKEKNMRTHTEKDANGLQSNDEKDASKVKESKVKESKVKERKEPEIFHPPDLSKSNLFREPIIPTKKEVLECFVQNGGDKEMAKSFWDRNEATGWYFKGSPITNFRNFVQGFISMWKTIEQKEKKKDFKPLNTDYMLKKLN